MGAVWMRARAELRARWRALVALSLLIALTSTVAMTAIAGARRTESSYRRLLAASRAYDVEVAVQGEIAPSALEEVASLPQVAQHGRIVVLPSDVVDGPDAEPRRFEWNLSVGAVIDGELGREWEVARVVQGRHPNLDDPTEAAVSESFLRARDLSVGDRISFRSLTFPEMFRVFGGEPVVPSRPANTVEIVGVWRLPHDVSFVSVEGGLMYLTPAFYRERAAGLAQLDMMYVRLHRGAADEGAFIEAARDIARRSGDPEALGFQSVATLVDSVQRALDVQALALWLFGGLVALAGVLVVGQALARALLHGAGDFPLLGAVGMSRAQLVGIALLLAAIVSVAGAAVGVALAVAASPSMPLGIARPLEPSPGVAADWLVLGPGAVLAIVALLARALPGLLAVARARATRAEVSRRVSIGAEAAARAGMPPTSVVGVRLALEPGGRGAAVPMRVALAGTVVGIAAVAGAFTFGTSFDRLLETPREFGWNWDIVVEGGEDRAVLERKARAVVASPYSAESARLTIRNLSVDGANFDALAFDPLEGSIGPTVLEGRAPGGPDEVALGSGTMRRQGLAIGDTFTLPGAPFACAGGGPCDATFQVVGRIVLPSLDEDRLDEGGVFTADGLARVSASEGFSEFAVRFPSDVSFDEASASFGQRGLDWSEPLKPVELQNLARVRAMPYALAGVLGALASATLAQALVSSVRRRRHDLAVLKAMGFDRGQVARTVAWQASTLIVVAMVAALPLGIAGGRWAWLLMNSALGVGVRPLVPVVTVAAGVAATLALGNAIALVPARLAARTRPAVVLREE